MFKKFYPDKIANSVFELDESFYKKSGIKGVIFDIDNTLVCHHEIVPPQKVKDYFGFLSEIGIKAAIASNNYSERVEPFCKELDVPYVSRAWKPFKKNLKTLSSELSLMTEEICLVGDQIFTDIYGGKRMGFYTVLVAAVGENETSFVAFKRFFEKLVINEYYKSLN